MAELIAKTYGNALYELAVEQGNTTELQQEAEVVRQALADNQEYTKLLNHPNITKQEKLQILEESFKGKISDDILGIMVLTLKKDRHNYLVDILDYFISKVKEHNNIAVAYITSAIDLDNITKDKVKARLLELTKKNEIEMNFVVDSSLIGGLIIRIGDRVMDNSIKGKLNGLAKDLYSLQLV